MIEHSGVLLHPNHRCQGLAVPTGFPGQAEGLLAFLGPKGGIEIWPALEGKGAIQARGPAQGAAGRLDQQAARTAEGVCQGHAAIPTGEGDQSGREIFLQGRQTHGGPVAAAVQAAATAIQAQGGFRLALAGVAVAPRAGVAPLPRIPQVQVDGQVGVVEIHRGAGAPVLALQVDDGVFDLQGAVVAVVEAGRAAAGIHPEAGLWGQPVQPIDGCLHTVVEVIFSVAREVGEFAQQPKGQAGLEMQAVEAGEIRLEAHGPA